MSQKVISTLVKEKDTFLLLIHHSPDGDAVASSLALAMGLHSMGKRVDIVCADPIPAQFHFLPWVDKIKYDFLTGDYDVVMTLDCGDSKRTGFRSRLKDLITKKKILVNIDHHPKNDLHILATYNFVDDTAPSTSYLIYDLLKQLGVPLNHRMATCLLTGLYTDTGGFKHPNTTPEALKFAATLLSYGARLKDITYNITQLTSAPQLKLWGVALSRIRRHETLDLISTYIRQEDLDALGATEKDIAGIATLLSTIPASASVVVVEDANRIVRVRMRTKNKKINLLSLAAYLGGGGQKKSAGFSLENMQLADHIA